MYVDRYSALKIVDGCELVKTSSSNGHVSKKYVDLRTYIGTYGHGYTIEDNKTKYYYVFPKTEISKRIYDGEYSVKDVAMTSQNCRSVRYNGVPIVPTWFLKLDTITGKYEFYRTEDYKPMVIAGRKLIYYFVGPITEKDLRLKIKRKMRDAIRSGKAVLV